MLFLFRVALYFLLRGVSWCHALLFVLVFFSPFSIVITSLGEERTVLLLFVYSARVDFCPYSLSLVSRVGCGL